MPLGLCRGTFFNAQKNKQKRGIAVSIIAKIYRNSIQPSEHSMRKDKEYTRAKNQIDQCYQNMCKTLSDYERAVLDKLISCYEIKIERKNRHCFMTGFDTGIAVAVEALRYAK